MIQVREASWPRVLLTAFMLVICALAPVIYGVWWFYLGGQAWEKRHWMESLAKKNPIEDAQEAIHKEQYWLYQVHERCRPAIPPRRYACDNWREKFGYRVKSIYSGKPLTPEQKHLNRIALHYMNQYNKMIIVYVNRHFPEWNKEKTGFLE